VPRISAVQVAEYAWEAGFRGTDFVRAVATALAESGGPPFLNANTDAVSSTGCCYGLWQINVRVHKQYTAAQMRDPRQNAAAAYALFKRDGWRPWNSSRAGMMLAWPVAAEAAGRVSGRSPSNAAQQAGAVAGQAASAAGSAIPGFGEIGDAANRITRWVTTPANVGRVVMVVGGVVLVLAALIRIAPVPTPNLVAKVLR
jgi:Lysozyme like domain